MRQSVRVISWVALYLVAVMIDDLSTASKLTRERNGNCSSSVGDEAVNCVTINASTSSLSSAEVNRNITTTATANATQNSPVVVGSVFALRNNNNNGNVNVTQRGRKPSSSVERERRHRTSTQRSGLSLWIDEQQVKLFSGFSMEIYAIADGRVLPYILDPNFEKYLPVIPSEVGYVNLTWKSGDRKLFYHFDRLQSSNLNILQTPHISIEQRGRVPRKPKAFSLYLPCSGNASGVASLVIGLSVETKRGRPLPGTPLRFKLRKECAQRGPDPQCDAKCANGGWCDHDRMCQCPDGFMGQHCNTALCYPQCMNGGTCTAPGVCSCPPGYQGPFCEGGICHEKCLNGGKCIQKDTCDCQRGFYGLRCEYSKCVVPCLNGGRCKGVNRCRCPVGYSGAHCEVAPPSAELKRKLNRLCPQLECGRNGHCQAPSDTQCKCDAGWTGRLCQVQRKRRKSKRKNRRKQQKQQLGGDSLDDDDDDGGRHRLWV